MTVDAQAPSAAIDWEAVKTELGDIPWSADKPVLKRKSRDFYWFSPILKPLLDPMIADLVVLPRDEADVIAVAALAARRRIPVTIRGGGTGNYGQAVPLDGGIVLDMTGLDTIEEVSPGRARIQAGARMSDIDRDLRVQGWELRLFPSTRRTASIGGFVCGGATGAGAITYGQLGDPGAVLGARVVTVEENPRVIELKGLDVRKVVHAYGLNGIVTAVEMPTAPALPWCERAIAFDSLSVAARFAQALGEMDQVAKKLLTVHDPRIGPYLGELADMIPPGKAVALVLVDANALAAFDDHVAAHGGEVFFARDPKETDAAAFAHTEMPPLYEFAWNHTTLNALKHDKSFTYLQIRFLPGINLEQVDKAEAHFGDEMLLHLEFQRRFGRVTCTALPLVRYTTEARLREIIAECEAMQIGVSDPHSYRLSDAGWKRVYADQPAFKREADPYGLLNPGKLGPI